MPLKVGREILGADVQQEYAFHEVPSPCEGGDSECSDDDGGDDDHDEDNSDAIESARRRSCSLPSARPAK